MKISCAGWGFREKDMATYVKIVKKMGIRYAELNCYKGSMHLEEEMTKSQIKDVLSLAKNSGVKIIAIAASNDFTLDNREELKNSISDVKRAINLAAQLDTHIIRIFAGFKEESKLTEATYGQVVECLKEVAKYGKAKKVELAIENHGGITARGEQLVRLIKETGFENLGVNYDPANFYAIGTDPFKALNEIQPYINYVHLKDCKRTRDKAEYCALGDGEVDFKPILAGLKRSYDGYYSLEYEKALDVEEGTERSLNFLKTQEISL